MISPACHKRCHDLLRFSRYLRPYWDKQAVLYLCMVFSVLFALLQPTLTRLTIDHALLAKDLRVFNMLLILGIVSYLFSIPIEWIHKYTGFYLRTRVAFAVRTHFYAHFHSLSLGFARSRPVGEHLYRLGPDLEGVVSLIVDAIPGTLVFLFRFGLLMAICLWMDWKATMIVLAASPLIYLHTRYFTGKQHAVSRDLTETSQKVSADLEEALSRIQLIKTLGRERKEYRRYTRDMIRLIRLNVANVSIALFKGQAGRLLTAILSGGIAYFFGYRIIQGNMTFGEMTALTLYLFQLLSAIKALGGMYNDFVIKFIAMDRVVQTLDLEPEIVEPPDAIRRWDRHGRMSVRQMSFGYHKKRPPLLDRVDFDLGPGRIVGLTGPNGAGKTTFSHLLLRFYDPWQGVIEMDGIDIRRLSTVSLRRAIGLASRDSWLLNRPVRENICFGVPEIGENRMMAAAEAATAHEFIRDLPRGYDTVLGPGSAELSQGQRQCIGIARALAMAPQVLILDEAMSGLSSDRMVRILDNLRRLFPNTGIIVISHGKETLALTDRVLVLQNGRIEPDETGIFSHAALLFS